MSSEMDEYRADTEQIQRCGETDEYRQADLNDGQRQGTSTTV